MQDIVGPGFRDENVVCGPKHAGMLVSIQCSFGYDPLNLADELGREMDRSTAVSRMIKELSDVTPRQIRILSYMAEYPEELFGITEISERFSIAYQTARTDLMDLEARKYLWRNKGRKAFLYSIDEELVKKIDAIHRG